MMLTGLRPTAPPTARTAAGPYPAAPCPAPLEILEVNDELFGPADLDQNHEGRAVSRAARIAVIVAALLVLALAVFALAQHQRRAGYQKASEDYAKQAAKINEQRDAIGVGIAARQKTEQAKVHTVTRTLIEKVNVYVPIDSCALPPGFGRLHNAAAKNAADDAKLPDAARKPDAASPGTSAAAD